MPLRFIGIDAMSDGERRLKTDPHGIQDLLEPLVDSLGFELLGVEYHAGRNAVLRLYIDSPRGITVDDCGLVSHEVSGILDVEDPIPGGYDLEVSSPGMNRPLFRLSDFERYAGESVRIRAGEPVEGQRNFRGELRGVEDGQVIVVTDRREARIDFDNIVRANLVADVSDALGKKR